ncbi:MAG: tetratricopeptide repeat protein, partial [Candidatus Omnitrophica bacterium]|nr:tetratricopeptide repeat protein [Candidatus Omnitrophota bacterium]
PGTESADSAAYWLGWALYDAKKVDASIGQFTKFIEDRPSSEWTPKAILALGDIYRREGSYDNAIDEYERLINRYPNSGITSLANIRIGVILKEQGNFRLALEYFRVGLTDENTENNAQVQYDIAECYETLGMPDKAIEEYLKVDYKYPQGKYWVNQALLKTAELLEKSGENSRAYKIYNRLAEGDGQEAELAKEKIKTIKQYTR